MNTVFQKIIIIGYGKIAKELLIFVYEKQKDWGYQVEFIEHEIHPLSIIKTICKKRNIPFLQIVGQKELTEYLDTQREKVLIISANNNFLFSAKLVKKDNITIVNFHSALLPDYPGRNAPSWVIYMGEKETGITWHYVTEGIDEGEIIIQKRCAIGSDEIAYELSGSLMNMAYEAFTEVFNGILTEALITRRQELTGERKIYLSSEVPGNGVFSMFDEPEKVYRLLRSMDYGNDRIFPRPQTHYRGDRIEILRYRKIDKGMMMNNNLFLYMPLDGENVLKMKYRILDKKRLDK